MEPSKLRYTATHEWVSLEGSKARIGITDHAQKEISDIVFVELPQEGKVVKQKDSAMVIESVKAAFDIYSPVSGKIVKVNSTLKEKPETINRAPFGEGWLFEVECSDPKEIGSLMTEDQYNAVKHEAH